MLQASPIRRSFARCIGPIFQTLPSHSQTIGRSTSNIRLLQAYSRFHHTPRDNTSHETMSSSSQNSAGGDNSTTASSKSSTSSTGGSKPPMPTSFRSSKCLCGEVEISVSGIDKGAVLCHCSNCQAQSGSAFMHNHRWTKSEMKITKGKELVTRYKDKNTASGNELTRGFCSKCGSSLFLLNSAFKGLTILTVGTIKGERKQPGMELFAENRYKWLGDEMTKDSPKIYKEPSKI